jgi:hypothetical protein
MTRKKIAVSTLEAIVGLLLYFLAQIMKRWKNYNINGEFSVKSQEVPFVYIYIYINNLFLSQRLQIEFKHGKYVMYMAARCS